MWKITRTLGVIGLLTLLIPVQADEDAKLREVVDRAIKAHGGIDNLTKLKASTSKQKGKFHGLGDALDYTSEEAIQLPDRFRVEVHSKAGDQEFTFIQVINGNKGWMKFGDKTNELDKEALAEAKEQMNVATISHLDCLKKKAYKLSPLGDVKVGDRPAIGVRVERKGYRDVSLFFDKAKYLLLKVETRGKDVMQGGQEFTATTLYDDYKKVEGIMVAHKVKVERDGKPYVEGETIEEKISEKLDDSVFEKP
ncbi:MAG TPA: hypothetical protein VMF69_18900 [Gemmataceae bacterium]|nr:hypothetical protein [Gemmataceae bacterium]